MPRNTGRYPIWDYCDTTTFGWFCRRQIEHDGPCGMWPRWWNFSKSARSFRRRRHL